MNGKLHSKRFINPITRRQFIRLASLSATGFIAGCAVNPVTGEQQLMLVSEAQELRIDRENTPYQYSADYGVTQDKDLNEYISQVGNNLIPQTHRKQIPYSFRAVNATYVNAYAFPGGSIACTRGILLSIENEASLAALIGHELGHVNARHTAQQMSKGVLTQAFIGGLSVLAGTRNEGFGELASQLGMIGAGALLASYSRNNEREADALGMEYMVGAGYNPQGMVSLMDVLRSLNKENPNSIELMFSTHPMSDERYQTAVENMRNKYPGKTGLPLYRERFMDNTSKLRAIKDAVLEMQKGEKEMSQKKFPDAEAHFKKALKIAPDDYTALVMMATCKLVQKEYNNSIQFSEKAQKTYPQEAQAYYLSGFAKIQAKDFEGAYSEFSVYEKRLPGNTNTIFFKGYAQEGMKHISEAAIDYQRYLQMVQQGDKAQYAYTRLKQWGYVK